LLNWPLGTVTLLFLVSEIDGVTFRAFTEICVRCLGFMAVFCLSVFGGDAARCVWLVPVSLAETSQDVTARPRELLNHPSGASPGRNHQARQLVC
jgi:hypothetical protein